MAEIVLFSTSTLCEFVVLVENVGFFSSLALPSSLGLSKELMESFSGCGTGNLTEKLANTIPFLVSRKSLACSPDVEYSWKISRSLLNVAPGRLA